MVVCLCFIFIGACATRERQTQTGPVFGIGALVWRYVVGFVADIAWDFA